MVRSRARTAPPTEAEIEAFGNMAEQPPQAPQAPPSEAPRRHKEPKVTGYNFRMTATQQKLLSQAAEAEDISQQKLLERIVWPTLTARYGETTTK
ncbi:hypothetical protein GCM10009648_14660 [Tsukamurella spumae]